MPQPSHPSLILAESPSELITILLNRTLPKGSAYYDLVTECRKGIILWALARTKGNKTKAAALLKVHRNNLQRWLNELGLEPGAHLRVPMEILAGDPPAPAVRAAGGGR